MNPPTTVNSGVTTDSFFVLHDYWIIIDPRSGATATVEYTTGTASDVAGSSATWVTQGAYTTSTALKVEEDLQGLYFRITASGGSIDYSVNGELSEADRLTLRSYAKAVVNQLGVGSASAAALAPVSLSANTTLTRAAHYNRLIVVDVTAGNVTLTATGTDALLGDFISVDVIGGGSNTVTLVGVTAQSGYQLTAVSGGNVEARCDVAASFIASTRTISAGGAGATATLALVNGDFTSNNLNLTATHTNRVLDCSAVTIPVTLTIQTDASGGYDTTAAELKVLGSLTAPVAIVEGTGATVVGKVQVIQQGEWGGARRTSANTWALVKQQNNLSTAKRLSKRGYTLPTGVLASGLTNNGLAAPSSLDSCTVGGASTSDGIAEYAAMRRLRYSSVAAINRAAGNQASLHSRLDGGTSVFPVAIAGAVADNIATAPYVMGICSTTSFGTAINSAEPSASSINMDLLWMGADSGDTNMQIMHKSNASAVSATKVDLGAAFPKSQFVAYGLTIYKNNAGTAFLVVVENMNTDVFAVKLITTNLPRNDRGYHHIQARSSWGDAAAAKVDFMGFEIGVGS